MRVDLGTKAETLERLSPRLTRSVVLPLVAFTVGRWRAERGAVLAQVASGLGAGPLIVRSSARAEDTAAASNAGAFLSVAGVEAASLAGAVDRVIASYGREASDDQVLVQPHLRDVRLAGVLFTCDQSTGAPYHVFNFDSRTGATDAVTSGAGERLETYVRFRRAKEPFPTPELAAVFDAVREIEGLVDGPIEIELALDHGGRVVVFQVRRLVLAGRSAPSEAVLEDWLVKAAKKIEKLSRPHPHLHGTRSIFGVMPDWNPAEIIGLRPRRLALTLYKEIVTDSVWAYMRHNYGYRDLRSFPLLVSILGAPYVDVRVSFNSFVPRGVRESLSQRLVNYYVERLIDAPQAHDKVEFDIVFSCYYPGIVDAIGRLGEHGFSGPEIGEILAALRVLTNGIIHPARGHWREDLARIDRLDDRRRRVLDSPMSRVDKIYWLLEDCKRWGTLPFSGLARAAFIAVQFLRGFVATGVFSPGDAEAFLGSLRTITSRMTSDLARLRGGELDRAGFLAEYGHLRPGTYDILSPRYDEGFDGYFGDGGSADETPARPPFEPSPAQLRAIDAMLEGEGLECWAADILGFMRRAIEGREYAKLVFTRSLSDALVQLEALGDQCGLGRDDLSHLDVRTVLGLYSILDAQDLREILLREIEANRRSYEMTRTVRLPELLVSSTDVFHFFQGATEPNFVTLRSVTAPVVPPEGLSIDPLAGRIVCIRSADPGYDWIFSKGIAGLVSQYGGTNSHMAIRAAEQRIPAVIGCGERKFETWSRAAVLEIDCANRTVRVIRS